MTAKFETLVSDINRLFSGADLQDRIHHLTKELGSAFVDRFLEYAQERKPTLRLSAIGRPLCQLWFELNGHKGLPLSSETRLKFLYGTIIESLILFLAKEAGHEITDEQREVQVDGVVGHIDCVIDNVLVDIKSCSPRSFEKFQNGKLFTDDSFGYIGQLSSYRKALGTSRAAFIAVDKTLGKICVLELPEDAYDVEARISLVRSVVGSPARPARCFEPQPVSKNDKSGNLVIGITCSYCAWRDECWKDANNGTGLLTRFYSNGPKQFVKIVREPKLKYNEETSYEAFPVKD